MSPMSEMEKMFRLLNHITDCYAAIGDAELDMERRELVVTVDEGGKTIYAATLQLDGAIEAKCRLVRFELEQMIDECQLPILFKGAA